MFLLIRPPFINRTENENVPVLGCAPKGTKLPPVCTIQPLFGFHSPGRSQSAFFEGGGGGGGGPPSFVSLRSAGTTSPGGPEKFQWHPCSREPWPAAYRSRPEAGG